MTEQAITTIPVNQIVNADALTYLKKLPDNYVDMGMSSPPYWSLREYSGNVKSIFGERVSLCT